MTEKEKEAIDYFKDDIEFLEQELKNPNYIGRYITIQDREVSYLKTILNLIEKKQKEIEDDNFCLELSKKAQDIAIKVLEQKEKELEKYKILYEKALEDVTKTSNQCMDKDKIIKLMAEDLTTPINSKEWIIEYYTKKARKV